MEEAMSDTTVEVKPATQTTTAPTPAPAPAPRAPAPAPARTSYAWQSFRDEMDRVFDRFASAFSMPSLRRMFEAEPARRVESTFAFTMPAIDIAENDKSYKITAELPGLEASNVDISVSGDMLTIKGEKRQEKEEKNENYYLSERAFGSFHRSFTLPDGVDRDKISSELTKGVLTVTLPKTAEAQKHHKKIEVKVG
jgi:HSP20 family protein